MWREKILLSVLLVSLYGTLVHCFSPSFLGYPALGVCQPQRKDHAKHIAGNLRMQWAHTEREKSCPSAWITVFRDGQPQSEPIEIRCPEHIKTFNVKVLKMACKLALEESLFGVPISNIKVYANDEFTEECHDGALVSALINGASYNKPFFIKVVDSDAGGGRVADARDQDMATLSARLAVQERSIHEMMGMLKQLKSSNGRLEPDTPRLRMFVSSLNSSSTESVSLAREECVCDETKEQGGMQGQVITGQWLGADTMSDHKLLVRTCFPQLLRMVQDAWGRPGGNRVLVLGSWGVGKTYFLSYVARHLLLDTSRSFAIVIHAGDEVVCIYPNNEIRSEPISHASPFPHELSQSDTVLLFDSCSQVCPPAYCRARVLVTSLPNEERYHEFTKHVHTRLYIPLWSEDELELCRRGCYPSLTSRAALRDAYHKWGGVARWTMRPQTSSSEADFEHALSSMGFKSAVHSMDTGKCFSPSRPRVSDRLIHVAAAKDMRSMQFVFASSYVLDAVLDKMRNDANAACQNFIETHRDDSHAAIRKQVYIAHVHRLLAQMEKFEVRILGSNERCRIEFGKRKRKYFDALAELTQEDFGVPRSRDYAGVDAIALPNVCFKATTLTDPGMIAESMEQIKREMSSYVLHVWVVPAYMAEDFAMQKFVSKDGKVISLTELSEGVQGVRQAVLGIDVSI